MCDRLDITDLLAYRVREGEQYLVALEQLEASNWTDLYQSYMSGALSLPQKLVLIHPRYYQRQEAEYGFSPRGPSVFAANAQRYDVDCDAARVWGLPCRLKDYESVQADHFFPYSLGGPTVADNRLSLCALHNKVKTNDIHLFAWERGEPAWLSPLVDRIQRLIRI